MTLENPVNPIDPENPATDAHGKSDAHSGDPQEPLIPAPTKPEQKPRPHQCEVTCNKKRDWVDKITLGLEAFGLFVLIVYTIFTGLMYCANKKAADAAKSAADTAARQLEMAERPWVSIDTGKLISFGFQDDIGAYAAFDLGVSAMGHTPAQRVRALGRLVTRADFTNPALQTRAFCDEVEKTALRDSTIFPGQKNITVRASAIWGKDFAKNSKAKSVNFVVLGCLAYTDSFEKSHHTGFTFDLYRKDPTHPDLEMPIEVVPFGFTGQIEMTPNWSGFNTFTD